MYNFKSLKCYNCNSVIVNLPEMEIVKLNGLHFRCECCGHLNLLQDFRFLRTIDEDLSLTNIITEEMLAFQIDFFNNL